MKQIDKKGRETFGKDDWKIIKDWVPPVVTTALTGSPWGLYIKGLQKVGEYLSEDDKSRRRRR